MTASLIAVGAVSCGSTASSNREGQTAGEKRSTVKTEAVLDNTRVAPVADTIPSPQLMYINVETANLRADPSKNGGIVTKLRFLDPVAATGTLSGDWVEVEIAQPDGPMKRGWVHSSLLSVSKAQAEAVRAAGE